MRQESLTGARKFLIEAETVIDQRALSWWQPVVTYLFAQYYLRVADLSEAQKRLAKGLMTIKEGGAPEYEPLILLELAKLESSPVKKDAYLERCIEVAAQRSRYTDMVICLREAGTHLLSRDDLRLKELGKLTLTQADTLAVIPASIRMIK